MIQDYLTSHLPRTHARATHLFAHSSMDFITNLPPTTNGSDSILVMVDHSFSKGVILIPYKKKISALGTADPLISNLFKHFGLPDKLISDHDPRFTSQTFQKLAKALRIHSSLSTTFHPQSDGTTEHFNQEIEAYLSIYCISNLTNWPAHLPILEFIHNSRRHADCINTPFELMYGYAPPALPTSFQETKIPELDECLRLLNEISSWSWPFCNTCDLDRVHRDRVMGDDHSKVLDSGLLELTLVCAQIEFVLL